MSKLTAEDWAKKIITECEPCREEGSWMRKCGGCLQHAYSLARAVLDKPVLSGVEGTAKKKLTAGEKFAIKNLRSVLDESAPATLDRTKAPPGYVIDTSGPLPHGSIPQADSRAAKFGEGAKWIWIETATGKSYQDGVGFCYDEVEAIQDAWRDYDKSKPAPAGELGKDLEKIYDLAEEISNLPREDFMKRHMLAPAMTAKDCVSLAHGFIRVLDHCIDLAVENGRLRDRIEIDLAPAVDFYQAEIERLKKEMEDARKYQIEICHDCAVKIETKVRKDLSEQDGWTAVEKELPEIGELSASRECQTAIKLPMDQRPMTINNRWFSNNEFERRHKDVTHWRPLPEPPETGDE